jgi:hypothetical protein
MRRCDWCGGRFGLISHRRYRKRFCSKTCKADHVLCRRRVFAATVLHWLRSATYHARPVLAALNHYLQALTGPGRAIGASSAKPGG